MQELDSPPKKSFLIGLAGLIPDIDALFLIHRWFTHSIFFILAIFIPAYLITINIFKKYDYKIYILLIFIGASTHILMDLFQSYTPILYPLAEYSYWINLEANIVIGENIEAMINVGINQMQRGFPKYDTLDAPIFTSVGFIISVILLLTIEYSLKDGILKKIRIKP